MYWSRKFKLTDCKECNYIGIARNDKRHAEKYVCEDGTERKSRLLNRKEEVASNKLLNVDNNKSCCNTTRSLQHLYRANQPNKNEKNYSYSYNDLLRIKRYKNNLPSSSKWKTTGESKTYGERGNCDNGGCNLKNPHITWKPNNKKYGVQGAVMSSSRIDRLKLETIRAGKKCSSNNKCNGKYVGDKIRYTGKIYNANHKEPHCTQNKARSRARGQYSKNC